MSDVLAEAIAEIKNLPPEEQERIGRWLMEELRSECEWSSRFQASADKLSKLAAEARLDATENRATDLDPDQL